MTKYIFIALTISCSLSFAGGDSGKMKILDQTIQNGDIVVFNVQWLEFPSNLERREFAKLRFEFGRWPKESGVWLSKLLPWTHFEERYPRKDFDECVEIFKKAYKEKTVLHVGKMGTVDFRLNENGEYIVPFARNTTEFDGSRLCYLYGGPI